jgi:hypothetical protein
MPRARANARIQEGAAQRTLSRVTDTLVARRLGLSARSTGRYSIGVWLTGCAAARSIRVPLTWNRDGRLAGGRLRVSRLGCSGRGCPSQRSGWLDNRSILRVRTAAEKRCGRDYYDKNLHFLCISYCLSPNATPEEGERCHGARNFRRSESLDPTIPWARGTQEGWRAWRPSGARFGTARSAPQIALCSKNCHGYF